MITTHCIISRNQGIVYKNPLLVDPATEPPQENVGAAKRRSIVRSFTALLFVSATAKPPRPLSVRSNLQAGLAVGQLEAISYLFRKISEGLQDCRWGSCQIPDHEQIPQDQRKGSTP